DTSCATLANSVRHAFVASVQSSPPNTGVVPAVVFRHDGSLLSVPINLEADSLSSAIPFNTSATSWKQYSNVDPVSGLDVFLVGRGVDLSSTMGLKVFDSENDTHLYNFKTGPGIESQLSFHLDVRRYSVTLPLTPPLLLTFENLFEIQVKIYRNFQGLGSQPLRAYTTLVTGNRIID
ncbi:MAG: hypothetical protein AABZ60_22150, partial [Planctomycetota bacterium]